MQYFDYHVHTDASPDGDQSIEQLAERAIALGLAEIAVTDHCDLGVESTAWGADCIAKSVPSILKAQQQYQGKLAIRCGIELGQANHDFATAEQILSQYQFDFVLASLHNLKGQQDFYYCEYTAQSAEQMLDQYYEELLEIVRWNKFDSLAHLNYPLRYICGESMIKVDIKRYERQIRAVLQLLAQNGKALEINTSGWRQRYGKSFVDRWELELFREYGGQYITVGSDCHRTEHLGLQIKEGVFLAKSAGFTHITTYERHRPIQHPICN